MSDSPRPPVALSFHLLARAARRHPLVWAFTICLMTSVLGCNDSDQRAVERGAEDRSALNDPGLREDLLAFAVDNLDHLEEFNNQEILARIVDRLNEWMRLQQLDDDWQPDQVVDAFPPAWRALPSVEQLGDLTFTEADASHLQEIVWLRNVARVAEGDQIDEVSRATHLFDWIVRNVQLDANDSRAQFARTPGQTLLLGRGDAIDRAWLFVVLARQAHLDVVVLGFADPDQASQVRFWLPALLHQDELYLYDTRLGLPLPGPAPNSVATLSQVISEPDLLRHLDLDGDHPYPVTQVELARVVALVEAAPNYLSQRMEVFENNLAGAQKLILTVQADELLARVRALPHVTDARLWDLPYVSIEQQSNLTREQQQALLHELQPFQVPALWNGRLHHLKGDYVGDLSANRFYQAARPPDEQIETQVEELQGQMLLKSAKRNASYWLGLVAFERGLYGPAIEHFTKRTLEASPGGPWTYGARYNLARAYEADGQLDEAIPIYESDNSPQQHGNRLRARRLRESLPSAAEQTPAEPQPSPAQAAPDTDADAAP